MIDYLLTQGEYLIQLLVALICGGIIGYERQNRMKEPGIRTHIIVSLAAAMMMIISKCGFFDVIKIDGIDLDPSRIAASVVTAVGFLGAGAIFFHNRTVIGLTTSAGMWATVGVGMAIGARMYFLGVATTLLILLVQVLLHRNFRFMRSPFTDYDVVLQLDNDTGTPSKVKKLFEEKGLEIVKFSAKRSDTAGIKITATIRFPKDYDTWEVIELLNEVDYIKSIEV